MRGVYHLQLLRTTVAIVPDATQRHTPGDYSAVFPKVILA